MPLADVEVLTPASADEAIAAFGDGGGVTVIGGGTIVMPDLASGRLRPDKALLLSRAGLDGVARGDGKVTIGAAAPLSALEDGDEPLATAARHCADPEIRGQATVGGNVCSVASADAPRGDLQAPLIALGASVRSVGAGGERTEPIEDFLANGPLPAALPGSSSRSATTRRSGRPGTPRRRARTRTTTRSSRSRLPSGTESCASPPPASARTP